MRDHLNVDARLVHLSEADLTEVIQPAADLRRATFRTIEGRRQLAIIVVLFQGDNERLPLWGHVCSSMRPATMYGRHARRRQPHASRKATSVEPGPFYHTWLPSTIPSPIRVNTPALFPHIRPKLSPCGADVWSP